MERRVFVLELGPGATAGDVCKQAEVVILAHSTRADRVFVAGALADAVGINRGGYVSRDQAIARAEEYAGARSDVIIRFKVII